MTALKTNDDCVAAIAEMGRCDAELGRINADLQDKTNKLNEAAGS